MFSIKWLGRVELGWRNCSLPNVAVALVCATFSRAAPNRPARNRARLAFADRTDGSVGFAPNTSRANDLRYFASLQLGSPQILQFTSVGSVSSVRFFFPSPKPTPRVEPLQGTERERPPSPSGNRRQSGTRTSPTRIDYKPYSQSVQLFTPRSPLRIQTL